MLEVDGARILLIDGTMFTATPEGSREEIELVIQSLRFGSAPPASMPSFDAAEAEPGFVDIGGRALSSSVAGPAAVQ